MCPIYIYRTMKPLIQANENQGHHGTYVGTNYLVHTLVPTLVLPGPGDVNQAVPHHPCTYVSHTNAGTGNADQAAPLPLYILRSTNEQRW